MAEKLSGSKDDETAVTVPEYFKEWQEISDDLTRYLETIKAWVESADVHTKELPPNFIVPKDYFIIYFFKNDTSNIHPEEQDWMESFTFDSQDYQHNDLLSHNQANPFFATSLRFRVPPIGNDLVLDGDRSVYWKDRIVKIPLDDPANLNLVTMEVGRNPSK